MKILAFTLFSHCFFFVIILLRYRWTYQQKEIKINELNYKMIDLRQDDFIRYFFESLLGNKRISLQNPISNTQWAYISKNDFKKLYPESPLKMKEKNYTIEFTLQYQSLVFGGNGLGKVLSHQKINKSPNVSKS